MHVIPVRACQLLGLLPLLWMRFHNKRGRMPARRRKLQRSMHVAHCLGGEHQT